MVRNSQEFEPDQDPLADAKAAADRVPKQLEAAAREAGNSGRDGTDPHPGSRVHAAREEAEMKAAIVLAKRFPRDESEAYARIMRACDRPAFAESANYAFPRGGQTVTGPSVDLARELARIWGNIRYGMRIVNEDDERVHVKGYAYDLESNTYVEAEDKFAKLVQRRNRFTHRTEWVRADERDLRELVNKRGAICVRNAILQLLPSDITQDAMARCRDTVQKAAKGEIQLDRDQAIRRLSLAFHDIGVNNEMIAGHLRHPVELITNEEIADLRAIYKSIRDGNSRREEYFVMPAHTRNEFRSAGGPAQGQTAPPRSESPGQAPRPGGEPPRPQPARGDPQLDQAKKNMQHVLGLFRQRPTPAEPEARPEGKPDEPRPWERLAQQAAEHWDSSDRAAVLRRLNKEAMTRYGLPLRRLSEDNLADLETRVVGGEVTIERKP